jgi:hypothetical protein
MVGVPTAREPVAHTTRVWVQHSIETPLGPTGGLMRQELSCVDFPPFLLQEAKEPFDSLPWKWSGRRAVCLRLLGLRDEGPMSVRLFRPRLSTLVMAGCLSWPQSSHFPALYSGWESESTHLRPGHGILVEPYYEFEVRYVGREKMQLGRVLGGIDVSEQQV